MDALLDSSTVVVTTLPSRRIVNVSPSALMCSRFPTLPSPSLLAVCIESIIEGRIDWGGSSDSSAGKA